MARVKGGFTTRRRRKKTLKLAKGYFGSKHALYKTAQEKQAELEAEQKKQAEITTLNSKEKGGDNIE